MIKKVLGMGLILIGIGIFADICIAYGPIVFTASMGERLSAIGRLVVAAVPIAIGGEWLTTPKKKKTFGKKG